MASDVFRANRIATKSVEGQTVFSVPRAEEMGKRASSLRQCRLKPASRRFETQGEPPPFPSPSPSHRRPSPREGTRVYYGARANSGILLSFDACRSREIFLRGNRRTALIDFSTGTMPWRYSCPTKYRSNLGGKPLE